VKLTLRILFTPFPFGIAGSISSLRPHLDCGIGASSTVARQVDFHIGEDLAEVGFLAFDFERGIIV
jgi:hypothetical protein